MTRFQRVRKALALLSATVLIAAFVLYRIGFHQAFMPSSKSTFIFIGSSVKPSETPSPTTDAAAQHEAAIQPTPAASGKPGE